jgi:hypothetical protein
MNLPPERLAEDPRYRRLPVTERLPWRHVSLWLAEDHLLVVDVLGFVERYRRYRLTDLRAVTVRPTRTGPVVAAACGIVFLLAGGLLAAAASFAAREGWPPAFLPFLVILTIPTLLGGLAFLLSLIRIRTAEAVLLTTVHEGPIPGITRLATARRLADLLEQATRTPAVDTADPGA